MNAKLNQPVRRMLGFVVKCVAIVAVLLITACSENEPPPPPPVTTCHSQQLPSPTITHETELGKNDGIIKNSNNSTVEVSSTRDFSSGNFSLQPGATKESLPAGNYYARWAAYGTCPADSRTVNITIKEGVIPPPPPVDIESVVPYTEGSNQEWVLWALAQESNSAEKIRFYNFLLKAHTYMQIYDENDYIAERDEGKARWESLLQNTDNEVNRRWYELKLADDSWTIYCKYPTDKPFQLSAYELMQVCYYLHHANPQLFLTRIGSHLENSASGQSVLLSIDAYYAFAKNRQEIHKTIIDGFDVFKSNFEKANVNINNRYDVVKYVYDDIARTLSSDPVDHFVVYGYVSRETSLAWNSILGYFGDSKLTICDGYAKIVAYLQNRLGVPTIYQIGEALSRDESGNITGYGSHAWNIVNMGNEENAKWYALDATGIRVGNYNMFLKGRGADGRPPENFLYYREPSKDYIYPECEIGDYPIPAQ